MDEKDEIGFNSKGNYPFVILSNKLIEEIKFSIELDLQKLKITKVKLN